MKERTHSLIITIVNRGFADLVVDSARNAGAQGGTVLHARGTGVHELEKHFGVSIQPEKELILTLVEVGQRAEIMEAIRMGAGLSTEGKGLSFSLPVDDVVGIVHMLKEAENQD